MPRPVRSAPADRRRTPQDRIDGSNSTQPLQAAGIDLPIVEGEVAGLMPDLFDAPVLPGLTAKADLIDPAEERMLIERIDASDLTPFRFQRWTGKRLTASFGWSYDFEAGRPVEAPPIPDWLRPFRRRSADFVGVEAEELIQALLIRYDPGAGIGWHRDRPIYGHVVGLSLGEPATMRFRRRRPGGFDRASLPLDPRGGYHMTGPARHDWEHSIAEMERPRWSITFRSLAEPG